MLRPASRRAARQSASPYRSDSPYRPEPYGPEPYGPEPHGPEAYGREQYGREQYGREQYANEQYGHEPYAREPHEPEPYAREPYTRDPYAREPYAREPYEPGGYGAAPYAGPAEEDPSLPGGDAPPRRGRGGKGRRRRGRGRIRRLLRRPTARVILALIALFFCWVTFSVGQALTAPGGGSVSSRLAEWARGHYLGPVVTFGEWISYQPPKVGGTPGFSLTAPGSAAGKAKYKRVQGFQPNIPLRLTSPAGQPLPGEGIWRVLETVKGEPAIFGTFLRNDSVHTSYVSGIVSLDQRLVSFQLRPGAQDPGPGNWKAASWIPPGTRTGLLATFNGGFKLNSAGGGFYLNGASKGALVDGAASVVYYRNGTIKIGAWGSEVRMTPDVAGVRQNLKLLVDHGKIAATLNQNVQSNWGATLGGGYYVWRSGIGITQGGRIIFVYGPGLNVQDLATLLRRAGAVEALQLDINPFWMSFEYYQAHGIPSDPRPVNLLPTQQQSAYRYYSVYSRDFTVVYAR